MNYLYPEVIEHLRRWNGGELGARELDVARGLGVPFWTAYGAAPDELKSRGWDPSRHAEVVMARTMDPLVIERIRVALSEKYEVAPQDYTPVGFPRFLVSRRD